MVLTNRAAEAGDFYQDAEINQVQKSAVAISKGAVIGLVTATDDFTTAGASVTARRFAVAVEDAAASATKVRACVRGHVNVTAQGAIGIHNRVTTGSVAGTVAEFNEASGLFNSIVGTYIGHPLSGNERDGVTATNAADTEVIVIRVGI